MNRCLWFLQVPYRILHALCKQEIDNGRQHYRYCTKYGRLRLDSQIRIFVSHRKLLFTEHDSILNQNVQLFPTHFTRFRPANLSVENRLQLSFNSEQRHKGFGLVHLRAKCRVCFVSIGPFFCKSIPFHSQSSLLASRSKSSRIKIWCHTIGGLPSSPSSSSSCFLCGSQHWRRPGALRG